MIDKIVEDNEKIASAPVKAVHFATANTASVEVAGEESKGEDGGEEGAAGEKPKKAAA